LDAGATVEPQTIEALGYGKKGGRKAGIKVLADVEQFSKKLHLKVHAISASAKARIEAAGGTVEILAS
jgi:large subunit ribosomal protein L15